MPLNCGSYNAPAVCTITNVLLWAAIVGSAVPPVGLPGCKLPGSLPTYPADVGQFPQILSPAIGCLRGAVAEWVRAFDWRPDGQWFESHF